MKTLLFRILLMGLLPFTVHAVSYDSTELSDQPGTQLIKPLLAVVSSGNAVKIESFIKKSFHPEFLEAYSMEIHVEYLLDISAQQGELTFHSLRTYDEPLPKNQLVVIFKAERTESWRAFTIDISDDKAQKINGLEYSGANPPRNLPKPGRLTIEAAIEELDGFVKRMASKDVFSGSVLLAKGDDILYQAAYGMASKRYNVANNLQTKFNLGSMNKMFTATTCSHG